MIFQSHDGTSLENLDKEPILVVSASNPYETPTFDPAYEIPCEKNTQVMKNGSIQLLSSVGKFNGFFSKVSPCLV